MGKTNAPGVRNRRVFYIPGYDPIHPRRYRELYRTEGAAQAEISGYQIDLTGKNGTKRYGWHVAGHIAGQQIFADVDVLVWSDIVRGSMQTSIPATYCQLCKTAWIYISTGTLWRLMQLRKGPVIAALYPIGMLLGQLGLAVLVCALCIWLANLGLAGVIGGAATFVGAVMGAGAAVALLRWFKQKDGKFFAYYLMHDYAYSAATRGAYSSALEARIAEFAAEIAQALRSDVDEVLVVGHSSGAHLGVSVLSDLLRQGSLPKDGPQLSFLSLGQVVPMVSFLPDAARLRGDLRFLSQQDQIFWVDVTAPGDGCAFALCDPVAVSGVAPAAKAWPIVFSAAFTQTLSPARWKELRWRFFRLHFQYLCAFDRPKDYDYFQITAGPLTLQDRYNGRPASRSRIEAAVNKYTSVTV